MISKPSQTFLRPLIRFGLLLAGLLLLACASSGAGAGSGAFDPVVEDPPEFDSAHPPLLVETVFEVDGAGMNALIYEAQGPGPHPTVVLLHGFPGSERNLDLAQAIRRAGWNVVFFHYRGAWGSGGEFSFIHLFEDVAAVVDAISLPSFAAEHRIDPDTIALVGHSMGAFAALVAGAENPEVDCVVSIAGFNLGGWMRVLQDSPDQADATADETDRLSSPIKGLNGSQLNAQALENADRFDTFAHADVLATKPLLLIAGARDEATPAATHHAPLVAALEAASARSLQATVFEDGDHSFSGQRIALARVVVDFLRTSCSATPKGA